MIPIEIKALWIGGHTWDIVVHGEHYLGTVQEIEYQGSLHDSILRYGTNLVAADRQGYLSDVPLKTMEAAAEWLAYRWLLEKWGSGNDRVTWLDNQGPVYDEDRRAFVLGKREMNEAS